MTTHDDELTRALAATPLGEPLAADDLGRLAAAGSVRGVPAGEVLRREGEAGGTLFVLLDGEVEVVKEDNGGEERLLSAFGPGSLVGEIGFLCGEPASATLRTRSPARLFELPRETLLQLADRGEPAAIHLALALARVLARRLARMNERAFELCEEHERELARAGVPEAAARVRDLAAFRAQLSAFKF